MCELSFTFFLLQLLPRDIMHILHNGSFVVVLVHCAKTIYFFAVPPDPLVIFDETGKRRASVVGPYLIGDTIHLACDAFGGKSQTFSSLLT